MGHSVPSFSPFAWPAPLAKKAMMAFERMLVNCEELQPRSGLSIEREELSQVRRLMAVSKSSRTTVGYCAAWLPFML